jgi:gas vesicle protein
MKRMKNSGLFIGLGVGLLVGAALGLFVASSEEQKAEWRDDIKTKMGEAKKGVGKAVKQGLEELDKAVETVKKTVQDAISKKEADIEAEAELV